MRKFYFLSLLAFSLIATSAFAHVVVQPNKVGVGAYQTFTVSVPSERELSTVGVRLMIPDNLESVTPTVKPGWNIEVKKHELPDGPHAYEIVWSGGRIPGHFRDDFTFSAKAPGTPAALVWKAYQTYSDGSVVAWDLSPQVVQPKKADGSPDFSRSGPYSQTNVVDDLGAEMSLDPTMAMSISALLIAIASLAVSRRRR